MNKDNPAAPLQSDAPVAWRAPGLDNYTQFNITSNEVTARTWANRGRKVEPLFAAPPPASQPVAVPDGWTEEQRRKAAQALRDFKELPDDMREPLHSLQADLHCLIGRILEDGSIAGMIADSIGSRLSQIETAAYRLANSAASPAAPVEVVADDNVHELLPHGNMTVAECLQVAHRNCAGMTDVLVVGYDSEGYLVMLSSKITREQAVFILLKAIDRAKE